MECFDWKKQLCSGKKHTNVKPVFFFIDRNVFEMTEKNQVISIRMLENIGE